MFSNKLIENSLGFRHENRNLFYTPTKLIHAKHREVFMIKLIQIVTLVIGYSQMTMAGLTEKSTPEMLAQGKTLYSTNCSACHGEKGDGNGPAGKMMNPKPRSFSDPKTVFKNGETAVNIFGTISNGLPGTAMPGFNRLSDVEKSALTHYVIELRKTK